MSAMETRLESFDLTGISRHLTATVTMVEVEGLSPVFVAWIFDDLASDSEDDEGCQETFRDLVKAEAYVERVAARLHCSISVDEPIVVIERAFRSESECESFELRCSSWVTTGGHIAHVFEVVHEWEEMNDGRISSWSHGHYVAEFDELDEARDRFANEIGRI